MNSSDSRFFSVLMATFHEYFMVKRLLDTHTHIVLTVLWAAKNTKYPINIILVVESMSFSLILSLADQWKSWNTFDLPWDSLHRYISILCMIIDFDITNCYNEYFHHWTFNWQTLRCYRLNNLTKFVLLRFWV